MGIRDEEIENASTIEGISQAFASVKTFLTKLRNSPENEGSVDITLAQTSSKPGHDSKKNDDGVQSFAFDMHSDIEALTEEIVEVAVNDLEGLNAKKMKYSVKADGLQARCVFTLKGDDGEEEDMDDVDDLPNRKGLLGLLMRHTQGQHKLSIGTSKHMIDSLMAESRRKDDIILALQRQAMENIKAYEELVSGRHVRDMEMKKMENKDRRMDQLAGTVLQGFPLLVTKFLGGGAGASAMQAVPGARTPMEGLVEGFIRTLDSEQFQQLLSAGVLRPDQVAGLVEIVKYVMEREEADKKTAAEKSGHAGSNGTSPTGAGNADPPKQEAHP